MKNPVMFVVEVAASITTRDSCFDASQAIRVRSADHALALVHGALRQLCGSHGRGPRQSAGRNAAQGARRRPRPNACCPTATTGEQWPVRSCETVIVVCAASELIPADGEIIEGVASVDESAITGESAPVIREAGGDRSAVTGGTRVLSDQIKVRITSNPGETFLDRMIALVEGAERQKTPNEIALNILLAGLTISFCSRWSRSSRLRFIRDRRRRSSCSSRCWSA